MEAKEYSYLTESGKTDMLRLTGRPVCAHKQKRQNKDRGKSYEPYWCWINFINLNLSFKPF